MKLQFPIGREIRVNGVACVWFMYGPRIFGALWEMVCCLAWENIGRLKSAGLNFISLEDYRWLGKSGPPCRLVVQSESRWMGHCTFLIAGQRSSRRKWLLGRVEEGNGS